MRILLDECVDEQLRHSFAGHVCQTARYAGLAGLENGELLKEAQVAGFEVLVTVNRGFSYQQNLTEQQIAVLIFCGKSVLLEDLLPLPACLNRLNSIQPGQIVRFGDQGGAT